MLKPLIETIEDIQLFIKHQVDEFVTRPDYHKTVDEIMIKMDKDGHKLSFDEKAKWVAERVMIGVPAAIVILKALGYMFVITWLPF